MDIGVSFCEWRAKRSFEPLWGGECGKILRRSLIELYSILNI
ncbi:hypothetical protein [Caballeronia cordobensis]